MKRKKNHQFLSLNSTNNCTNFFSFKQCFLIVLALGFTLSSFSQKNNGKNKDIVVRVCTQYIGNGLYRANFGYDNPTNKDINYGEESSYVKNNRTNKKIKGIHNFKKGSVDKAFAIVFNGKDVVEWTVINPNGKEHVVTASANSSHCPIVDDGYIFPLYGQGQGKENQSSIIGLDLSALNEGEAGDNPTDVIFQINSTQKVLVEIVPVAGNMQNVINLLTNTYGLQFNSNAVVTDFIISPSDIIANNLTAIDIYFPIDKLHELNLQHLIINFVRPLAPTFQNSGIVVSQGDAAQKSDVVRESFRTVKDDAVVSVDGAGIKIGVISDSYDKQPFTGSSKATVDVLNGDLPGIGNTLHSVPVDVLKDYPIQASDEGRAMLQIIHDVAPGAELAFHTGSQSPRVFELGLKALAAANCDIIVDDLTFLTEPFFGEGRISQAIKTFTSAPGNLYFTSAGNFANHGYQSNFQPASTTIATNFLDGSASNELHTFGTNTDGTPDVLQKIHVEIGTYMIVLQWDEGFASQQNNMGATIDLDIYLTDDFGNLLVGNNRFNDAGDPTEILVFQATAAGNANILINSATTSNTGLPFRYIAYRYDGLQFIEYGQGAPTVTGHAMTAEANTIGAVDYRNAENPVIESFSSIGGTLTNQAQIEIDFASPDGGNTNVGSIGQDYSFDEDNFNNFYGTSAAAPHAAASVALLLSAAQSWYPNGLPIEAPVRTNAIADKAIQLFKQTAVPFGIPAISGAGLIHVENAFTSIAAQTPKITLLVLEDGKTPSAEPFALTIIGKFFTNESTVFFDGNEVEIISRSANEIVAKIGAFTGNPDLQVYTEPVSEGGTDGGFGDPVKILEDGKIALNVIADAVTIEFGQDIDLTYTVEGLVDDTTFESLGLPELNLLSTAILPYPDVNNYSIIPEFEVPLSEEQLASYQINIKNGLLEVTKKELTIQPTELTSFTYGDPIAIALHYQYNATGISDNEAFLEAIKNAHGSDFYTENTLVVINKFKAVINQYDLIGLLNQNSWIVSEHTITNRTKAIINGMNVIELENQHLTDYIDATLDASTNNFKAVINKAKAVINTQDLFENNVSLSIGNKTKAVINSSGLGDENDRNEYATVFAIIDDDDTTYDQLSINKLYALNLITGYNATQTGEDNHHVFPGGFLAAMAANFDITYSAGRLSIEKATLQVETGDLVINQDETIDESTISSIINGYVYDDTAATVFPDGPTFYFEDANGEPYQQGATGVFDIKIVAPQNYAINYTVQGKLYVNPFGNKIKNIRTYLDCVEYSPNGSGLDYIANFRYVNPNSETIYIINGTDNYLSGSALFSGSLPTVYFSGEGVFQIRFNGERLIWNLTSYDNTHKTAVSSDASASSGKCDAKVDNTLQSGYYTVYPNPVNSVLHIIQVKSETAYVEIYDIYGRLQKTAKFNAGGLQTMDLDVSHLLKGMFFVKIKNNSDVIIYNMIKD